MNRKRGTIFVCIGVVWLVGCAPSGVTPKKQPKTMHVASGDYIISASTSNIGKPLAYAVLDKKTLKLKKIVGASRLGSVDYSKEEIITIGEKGFSLYDSVYTNAVCDPGVTSSPKYCKSSFVTADMSGSNGVATVVTNTIFAPIAVMNGGVAFHPKLDKEKLKKVIKANRLDYYRKRLLSVGKPLRYFEAAPLEFDAIVNNYDSVEKTAQLQAKKEKERRRVIARKCHAGELSREYCYKHGFAYPLIRYHSNGKVRLVMLADKQGHPAGECKEYDKNGRLIRNNNFTAYYRVLGHNYKEYIKSIAENKTAYVCPSGYEPCGDTTPEVTYVHVGGATCATRREMEGCCTKYAPSSNNSTRSKTKECRTECINVPTAYGYTHRSCRRVCY